jgi:thiamine-monophosphate kinase
LININVVGEVSRGKAVRRTGAKPADRIFVSGKLGEAELGLRLATRLRNNSGGRPSDILKKHLYPPARVELGKWLATKQFATAMMDVSDGLSSDLTRLCEASHVGARVELLQVPLASAEFRKKFVPEEVTQAALHGGDDYELLFCVADRDRKRIPSAFQGLALTEIGKISKSHTIELVKSSGKTIPLRPLGWDPF